jgi:hypothetical protein
LAYENIREKNSCLMYGVWFLVDGKSMFLRNSQCER